MQEFITLLTIAYLFEIADILPVTFVLDPEPSSIHGPDKEPVGFGVALSYIFPISSFEDLHRCPGWYGSAETYKE